MRRQITAAILAFTTLAVALFGIPLAVVIRSLYVNEARTRLEREAAVASRDLPDDATALASLARLPAAPAGVTFTLYSPTGDRLIGPGPTTDRRARSVTALGSVSRTEDEHLATLVAVTRGTDVIAVLRADASIHAAEHRAHLAWVLMAALGGGITLIAGGLALVRANRIVRPLRRVRDGATRLGHGDYAITLAPTGVPELDELGEALTTTAGRLGDAMQRERSFSGHASHQLRTPLTGLRVTLESELLAPRADPRAVVEDCLAITDRLERTIDDLLLLARRPRGTERLDLARVLQHVHDQWPRLFDAAHRELRVVDGVPSGTAVVASTAAVVQALDVLIDNALRHGTGLVTLSVARSERAVTLAVSDEGPATEPAVRSAGRGIGLELATGLIESDGGRLIHPSVDRPTTYELVLPSGPSRPPGPSPTTAPSP